MFSCRVVELGSDPPAGKEAYKSTPPTMSMAHAGKKIVVFGGNGFVGSAVVRHAVQAGMSVVAASRSGQMPIRPSSMPGREYADNYDAAMWCAVNALDRQEVVEFINMHSDACAIVSTIGLLTMNHAEASRINGDANVNIAAGVFEHKTIPKFVYVSAGDLAPAPRVLKGYYRGKWATERAMFETLKGRSSVLKPAMVTGPRTVTGGWQVPLHWFGAPMEAMCLPMWQLTGLSILQPPSRVDDLGRAALQLAVTPTMVDDGVEVAGYAEIKRLASDFNPLEQIPAQQPQPSSSNGPKKGE